jgi:hypothetical protein
MTGTTGLTGRTGMNRFNWERAAQSLNILSALDVEPTISTLDVLS